MKVLFLCSELAGYFIHCIQRFKDRTGSNVYVISYPQGKSAPFVTTFIGIDHHWKNEFNRRQFVQRLTDYSPDVVYVSGWADRDYRRVCKQVMKRGAKVICGLDNVWTGSPKQRLACLFSPWIIKPYYSHLWAAGFRQYQFARRLHYLPEKILTGLYAADINQFSSVSHSPLNHYLIFVGRFENIKGVQLLYDVFRQLSKEERRDWKLKMIGNGSLKSVIRPTPEIEIYDFMQPKDLVEFVADAGGFILPSHHEPWGVVVQEFAAAGKPLILANTVNSGEIYLIHGYNGYKFDISSPKDLKRKLVSFFNLSDAQRLKMGNRSSGMAMRGNPDYWVAQLASLIEIEVI